MANLKDRTGYGDGSAEEIVASGKAHLVALARAFLDDARWGWHAAEALGTEPSVPWQYRRLAPAQWPGHALRRGFGAASSRGTRPTSPLGRFADCQTSANAAYRVNLSDMRRAERVSRHRRFGPDGVDRRRNGRKGLDRDFAPVRAFLGASCFAVAFRRGGDFAAPHDWML